MELHDASKDLDDPILKVYEWIKEAGESGGITSCHEFSFSQFESRHLNGPFKENF